MTEEDVEDIYYDRLKLLLDGIDFWKAHKEIKFQKYELERVL